MHSRTSRNRFRAAARSACALEGMPRMGYEIEVARVGAAVPALAAVGTACAPNGVYRIWWMIAPLLLIVKTALPRGGRCGGILPPNCLVWQPV